MIEYLYNAIRAVAGQELAINAVITDDEGKPITKDCSLVLHLDNDVMYVATGNYIEQEQLWAFNVPAEITAGKIGRYFYCLQHDGLNLCFKEPIYLI